MPDRNQAQADWIATNDIVVQIAKMIDPGAFQDWYRSTASDAQPEPPDARKRYKQAAALSLANEILKFAAKQTDLSKTLAGIEVREWERIGIPISEHPECVETVQQKYS